MRKSLKIMSFSLAMISLSVGLSSCEAGGGNTAQPVVEVKPDSIDLSRQAELEKIFFSIPAPMQMASLIKQLGYEYDNAVLNSTDNVSKYISKSKRAVNLGIYGADLSYASMFDQKQESMNYMAAAQKLAREMGVDGALQDDIIERLNNNLQSRDSLLKIVSEAYGDLNGYLKENDQIEVSALIVAGGWVEALYLSTRYVGSGNETIKTRIAEQKYSLDNLIGYFDRFGEQEDLTEMKTDLMTLKALFDKVQVVSGKTDIKQDAGGMVVIGNSGSITLDDATLNEIATKITEIRLKYTA